MQSATALHQTTLDHARQLDAADPLRGFRDKFYLPLQAGGQPYGYFTGNSLGCQPRATQEYVMAELEDWARLGVEGHMKARHPWMPYHEYLTPALARIAGAQEDEVVAMGALTSNLHFLLVSFYRPTPARHKILIEDDAFPSDSYAVDSQVRFHGYDPRTAVIRLKPRAGEFTLRTEDILSVLDKEGDQVATVLLGGVNYYTGQCFDMQAITAKAHEKGCMAGFDLAHAMGNVSLKLHDWGVDFAAWCSYKYLNSGPGGVAGIFVHNRHTGRTDLPRFHGWWGQDKSVRFQMGKEFHPIPTAEGWQHSNAPILSMAALRASLDLFDAAGMDALHAKRIALTGYLAWLLEQYRDELPIEIITPAEAEARGCQLSLRVTAGGKAYFQRVSEQGMVCDWREPEVMRVAPVPLYNSFEDVWQLVEAMRTAAKG